MTSGLPLEPLSGIEKEWLSVQQLVLRWAGRSELRREQLSVDMKDWRWETQLEERSGFVLEVRWVGSLDFQLVLLMAVTSGLLKVWVSEIKLEFVLGYWWVPKLTALESVRRLAKRSAELTALWSDLQMAKPSEIVLLGDLLG